MLVRMDLQDFESFECEINDVYIDSDPGDYDTPPYSEISKYDVDVTIDFSEFMEYLTEIIEDSEELPTDYSLSTTVIRDFDGVDYEVEVKMHKNDFLIRDGKILLDCELYFY